MFNDPHNLNNWFKLLSHFRFLLVLLQNKKPDFKNKFHIGQFKKMSITNMATIDRSCPPPPAETLSVPLSSSILLSHPPQKTKPLLIRNSTEQNSHHCAPSHCHFCLTANGAQKHCMAGERGRPTGCHPQGRRERGGRRGALHRNYGDGDVWREAEELKRHTALLLLPPPSPLMLIEGSILK